MSRKKKLFLNSSLGLVKQLVLVVCGFILPRYMLLYYGSDVNGLVSSITHFLGFISLLEMGIGPVVQASLYKPLADKNNVEISKVVISAERFFRTIAKVFLGYIAVLCFVFPIFVNSQFSPIYTISLLIIISISSLAQYFFGATYQLLLNADQKAYIQISLQIITVLLNTILCIVFMKIGASIHIVRLVTAFVYVLRPLGQMLYVRKHYKLNKKLVLTEEPIKQKWNGFSQHLAAVITGNADVVILTLFATLASVSIYSVYYNVVYGVTSIALTAATGLEAFFGNMLAKNETETLNKSFQVVEWFTHFAVTLLFTVTFITITPFISVYTKGVTDANYIAPAFGHMLTLAYAAECLRIPYFRMIKAAGHFKQTQNGAFISAGINIVISITLVFKFGLIGIAFGTLAAMLYHTCYFVWYLRKNIIYRQGKYYLKYLLTDVVVGGISYIIFRNLTLRVLSYMEWVRTAIIVFAIVLAVALPVYISMNLKQFKLLVKELSSVTNRMKKHSE